MKKLIIMFSVVIVFLTVFLILLSTYKDNTILEEVYAIKSNYSYLSDGNVNLTIKLYTNDKKSLLGYANKANVVLHDRSEENVVSAVASDSYISSVTSYNEKTFYEYSVLIDLEISKLTIEECYFTLTYSNKVYTFNIGRIEIREKKGNYNNLKISNLYGVSSENNVSLAGIIITINNDSDNNWKIDNIHIGGNNSVLLDDENIASISDSTVIEDYEYKDSALSGFISILKGEIKSYILPIKHGYNLYLYNCYLLIEINGEEYYISNFNYINSNDLTRLEKYITSGIIYDL